MLLGALIDIGADPKSIQRVLDNIPLHFPKCKALNLQVRDIKTHGFRARAAEFDIVEDEEETPAQALIRSSDNIARVSQISKKAASFAISSIKELLTVESSLHDAIPDKTHLHEAGSADTLADVFGVAAACDLLGIFDSEIYSTPVAVGGGIISFSHGTMAVPAPAVLEIARRRSIPIHGGPENVELATPTGIVILANLARNFVENYPPMIPEMVGLGAGRSELIATPNVLRIVMGRSVESAHDTDSVMILETNIDDVSGEVLGHALERVLSSGGRDAWITPAQFKKNRPGHVLHAICDSSVAENLANVIMEETGTLGVRFQQLNRFTLEREIRTMKVDIGGRTFDVRVKISTKSGRIVNIKPEFDDIQAIAKELSMPARKVAETVLGEIQRGRNSRTLDAQTVPQNHGSFD
jgi:uncharacterized protein (TIGR00299 family) protein